jgi:hypothetical protein
MWLDLLGVVCRQLHIVAADAAPYRFLIEIDFAVGVENGLAVARQWSVFKKGNLKLLLRGVVERSGDRTFALLDLAAGGDVVDEADWVAHLTRLFHLLIMKNQLFKILSGSSTFLITRTS